MFAASHGYHAGRGRAIGGRNVVLLSKASVARATP
jgi:hypothetical protein